jgi:RNA polymerase sigma-70 factor, ECF subfamily
LATHSAHEITGLLQAWCRGESSALERLLPLVQGELRRLAHRYMVRERDGHLLQTTALVNEAYLRLVDAGRMRWQDRAHFFAISANLMRRILVDYARSRGSQKRGGALRQVELDESACVSPEPDADLLEIDERKARVVELRFFGGMSLEESAEVLKVSADTVWRDWDLAKAWLYRELKHGAK